MRDAHGFSASDLERFLRAVDRYLGEEVSIVLIGGGAAAIAYKVDIGTTDLDTFGTPLQPLELAMEQARAETGLRIPVSDTAVAEVPIDYEDRLQRQLADLPRLTVFALEKHDLALSKAVRAEENDLAAMDELHKLNPLDEGTLVTRYLNEMDQANGRRRGLDENFLLLISRLYGEMPCSRARRRIGERRKEQQANTLLRGL